MSRSIDRAFAAGVTALAMLVPLTLVAITILIVIDSWPALTTFGFSYFTTTEWDPVKLVFGAAAYVYGTLVTTVIAVLLATPVAVGARARPVGSRVVSTRVVVIDNYDSFVYNLVQYLGELGAEPVVHRHDAIDQLIDVIARRLCPDDLTLAQDIAKITIQAGEHVGGRQPLQADEQLAFDVTGRMVIAVEGGNFLHRLIEVACDFEQMQITCRNKARL